MELNFLVRNSKVVRMRPLTLSCQSSLTTKEKSLPYTEDVIQVNEIL